MHSRESRRSQTLLVLKTQAVAAGIVSFLLCSPLRASELVELQLDAPQECPNRAAIEAALNRLVQRAPQAPLRVSARFAPDGNRWVLFAVFENGQRVIPGDSCLAVAEALVVIIALAIDPTASLQSEEFSELHRGNALAPQGQTPGAIPPPKPLPPIPNASGTGENRSNLPATDHYGSVPQRQKLATGFGMSLLMLTDTGALPRLSLGPALIARYGSRSYWGEFSASGLFPSFVPVSEQIANKGGYIGLFAGQLAGCAGPIESWALAGCVGMELGEMVGRGVNTGLNRWAYAPWYAGTASAVFRANLRRDVGMELRLGTAVPFTRPDFGLQGYGKIFQPDLASFRAMAGFSWR